MFDYNDLLGLWDQNVRWDVTNNFVRTLYNLGIWKNNGHHTTKGTYFEKEWMSQLNHDADEFIDTLIRLGLTPNHCNVDIKRHFWETLNAF